MKNFTCKECGSHEIVGQQLAVVRYLVLEAGEDMQVDEVEIISDMGPIEFSCNGCGETILGQANALQLEAYLKSRKD